MTILFLLCAGVAGYLAYQFYKRNRDL